MEEKKNSTSAKDYWVNELSGDWEKCGFHIDRNRMNGKEEPGKDIGIVRIKFNDELNLKILKLAGESETKLFMILASGLIALLHRCTGSSDIIIGSPIYKQRIEGNYINTILPIRSRLNNGLTFKELLLQVRKTIIEGSKNQNYPLDVLLYELDIPFEETDFPLFDVALLLENIHDKRYIQHTNPNMYFLFLKEGNSVEMSIEYRSRLYNKKTIARTGSHYTYLLQQALADVDTRLSQIAMMSQEEKEQVLFTFNRTGGDGLPEPGREAGTIPEYFADRVERGPDNIALILKGKNTLYITYKKLDQLAGRPARQLREKGVKADTIVALMLEPSVEMVAGVLAVLKAGGAYLPIDTLTPPRRIHTILKDSAAAFLVSQKDLADNVDFAGEIIYPGNDTGSPGKETGISNGSDLAYAIYTSGSTGIPRGVLIEHRNILNYVLWRKKEYNQSMEDVCLQLLSISFDGFCANFYPALLSGGKLVMITRDSLRDIEFVKRVIEKENITTMSLTPSYYTPILEKADPENLKTLRFVVLGGEQANKNLVELSGGKAPHIKLINEYGPTENSVTTTAHLGITVENLQIVGKPIANNYLFVLGLNNEVMPVGVPGELFVAGSGLSRGYLNNPDLTADKFLPAPPVAAAAKKLYRTGDIVRWLPDGYMEFVGRKDNQVKIRGYRVELGEIENCLLNHPGVKDAVVDLVTQNGGAVRNLCAFIVPREDEKDDLNTLEIREYLLKYLADYMVPAHFVKLARIPLTPSGKLNRKALDKLQADMMNDGEYVAPRTEIEKKLAEVWQETLGVEQIGVTNNFFNVGGDSIKILSILYAINNEFNSTFKVETLYENETIEKFALLLDDGRFTHTIDESQPVIDEMEELKKKFLNNVEESGGVIS